MQQVIDIFPLHGPHGLAFANDKLYFTAEMSKVIARYDLSAHQVDWILGTGQNRTHMVSIAKSLDRIYIANVDSGTVSIIDKVSGVAGGSPGPPPPGAPKNLLKLVPVFG